MASHGAAASSGAAAVPFRDRTRATKHQAKLPLPPGFAQVLKDYTREVLRDQPEDVLAWSAEYFKRMALACDPMQAQQPPPEHYAPSVENPEVEVMGAKIAKVFSTMDDQKTGFLYVHLVKRALLEALGLTKEQALYILSCDYVAVRSDGTMEYRGFARDAVPAVLFFQKTRFEFPDVSSPAEGETVHGMVRQELEDELLRVMRQADKSHLGRLTYQQYRQALVEAPLQFTQRDVDVLCVESEQTSDGYIDFRNAVGHAFSLLLLAQAFTTFDEQNSAPQEGEE